MTIEERNIEFSKLKAEITQNAILKECFLKETMEECSEKIINAHSLQRMGVLSRLEAEVNGNKKIYALTETQINSMSGQIELKPIGKKKASTFFGFCKRHDLIFQPIEQNSESINLNSDEHCFLLSLRAFSISYHRKREDINLLSKNDKTLRINIKKYFDNDNLEDQLEGAKLGLQDMEPNKKILINTLYSKDYSCLDLFTYELDYAAPVAMCMSTSPPFLFSGKAINISANPKYKSSDILTTVIPLGTRTLIVLAAFKQDPNGSKYLYELKKMDKINLQKALTWHILTNSENCFFSPKWFNKLNTTQKLYIVNLIEFASNLNTPYLKYDSKKFNLNLFDINNAL